MFTHHVTDHFYSYAKQPIWRTTSKLQPLKDRIIYGYSFVERYFSSNRGINASGLYLTLVTTIALCHQIALVQTYPEFFRGLFTDDRLNEHEMAGQYM